MVSGLLVSLGACAPDQPVAPDTALDLVATAWRASQHTVWKIDWPAAPVGGEVTVAAWRAGERYRLEVLETPAPALMGEVLVFDGQVAWSYNRFGTSAPVRLADPALSPFGAAFATVDRLLTRPIETASRQVLQLDSGPAEVVRLALAGGDSLALWRDLKTGLPVRLTFSLKSRPATWQASHFEALPEPPEELFRPARP